MLGQTTAGGGGPYRPPLDQLLAELRLERCQLLGDGRLTETEFSRSLGKRPATDDGQEGAQVSHFHLISIAYTDIE